MFGQPEQIELSLVYPQGIWVSARVSLLNTLLTTIHETQLTTFLPAHWAFIP